MKHSKPSKFSLILVGLAVYFLCFMLQGWLFAEDTVFIKDPKPTHVEKNYIDLVKVHTISPDIDDKNFMGRPMELVVDSKGKIFVYDNIVNRLFIFDKNFKFLRRILNIGEGPGEIKKGRSGKHIYMAPDDRLYVSDFFSRKMILFANNGDYIKDIKMPLFQVKETYPVVDQKNNYYFLQTSGNSLIDVLNSNFEKMYSLIDRKEMLRFIVMKPDDDIKYFSLPGTRSVRYDILSNDGLIVYLTQPSTAFIFEKDKLVKRFDIHPKTAIELYKKRLDILLKTHKKNTYSWLFNYLFLDKDDEKFFYTGTIYDEEKGCILYKFDLPGNLVAVYRTPIKGIIFQAKRHDYIYAINMVDSHVYIIKK